MAHQKIGYFVADRLLLSAGPQIRADLFAPSGIRYAQQITQWGLKADLLYFLNPWASIIPYIGAEASILITNLEFGAFNWTPGMLTGLLFPVNTQVAIHLGLKLRATFSYPAQFEKVEFIPGYLGVLAVF